LVLDGGACRVGIESTIVDCTRGAPIVLRPGQIIEQDILRLMTVSPNDITTKTIAPRVSGDLASHYAPDTPVALLLPAEFARATPKAGASMGFAEHGATLHRQMPRDAATYAQMLYATLRELDALHPRSICIECPPDEPAWRGVVDRLTRAASRA
jgi:L-threonylcarbamoyladenylate synthase